MSESPWLLFLKMFKYDEEIVVIDHDDVLFWGRLREINYEEGFNLLRPNGKKHTLYWEDIRFVGQDGFPLVKLKGADGSPSIEKLDTSDIQSIIRTKQQLKRPAKTEEQIRREAKIKACTHTHTTIYKRKVFGDPWMIEDFNAELVNCGNSGMFHYFNDTEELLLLEHSNGAKGQLFDIPSIYYIETEGISKLAI